MNARQRRAGRRFAQELVGCVVRLRGRRGNGMEVEVLKVQPHSNPPQLLTRYWYDYQTQYEDALVPLSRVIASWRPK
jgi:hypothetical protein